MIDLVLFENDSLEARAQMAAGVRSFLVDTEVLGKDLRQLGFDTDISPGTFQDLSAISSIPGARAWCRINRYGKHSTAEIDGAIAAGAHVLLLPMAASIAEVEAFLKAIDGRCRAAVMIETVEGAGLAARLGGLSIDHVFFGLNDFTISRGGGSIFSALVDGSVEAVREALPDVDFGVGGLTDIRLGSPVPAARILEELERLRCGFTFLRR